MVTGGVTSELGGGPVRVLALAAAANWPFFLRGCCVFGAMWFGFWFFFFKGFCVGKRGGDNESYKLLPSRNILGVGSR